MSEQIALDRRYQISALGPNEPGGATVFYFQLKGPMQRLGADGAPTVQLKIRVAVRQRPGGLEFDWSGTQREPGRERDEMEAEIAIRFKARSLWIERVNTLVDDVEGWGRDLGWATRRVAKQIDDAWVGKHEVPALLMQEDTCRIMLEPVARSVTGTEGVVDLYLMPAYDDIASLFFQEGAWNLQYPHTTENSDMSHDGAAVPFSRDAFEKVLAELLKHAA